METTDFIDFEDGLNRIGGNLKLYKRLLQGFVDGNYFEKLANALSRGDMDDAKLQAHTLKGVGANLSLVKVRALSAQLEEALKDGTDYSSCLELLTKGYDDTVQHIEKLLAE